MTGVLFRKLLRDVRLPLFVVALLLGAYQFLWAKITERISAQLLPMLLWLGAGRNVSGEQIEKTIFGGPGQVTRMLIGGDSISIFRVRDMLTVGFIHPLTVTILCIWAIGRAAGAVAGEIDRGTMELLLAQPLARFRIILAHFCVDAVTIPFLCLSLWGGSWLGVAVFGLHEPGPTAEIPGPAIDASVFGPALWNTAALLFAVSGLTLWLSAAGRFRWRVLGFAVFAGLVQFLINLVGQMWDGLKPLRPCTVFYYYQPQPIILQHRWTVDLADAWGRGPAVNVLAVLFGVGAVGYAMALWTFCRRDLPAPL